MGLGVRREGGGTTAAYPRCGTRVVPSPHPAPLLLPPYKLQIQQYCIHITILCGCLYTETRSRSFGTKEKVR